MKYKILCIGNQWRGSDDGSLFRAFSRAGHIINIVDDMYYVPVESTSFISKVFRKAGSPFFIFDYNKDIRRHFDTFLPDIVCVYKGASLEKATLLYMKDKGVPIICIYPDVSHFDHGSRIPECIPYYDFIFHTKTFGIDELKLKFNYSKSLLIQHCADPDIHRPLKVDMKLFQQLNCQASFIGSHSSKKESVLSGLLTQYPTLKLKIWGGTWNRSNSDFVKKVWQQQTIYGDLYAAAIISSDINIAILSEASKTTVSGDKVTSRTFHIPGCGGFMLHERTDEFRELFIEDHDAVCYEGPEELADKIKYFLQHPEERKRIAQQGHEKVMRYHTSDHRVEEIILKLRADGIL